LAGAVVDGAALDQLKAALIERLGVKDTLLCASGSLALEIALRAYGIGPGDEVVVPTFCCTSVVSPVLALGACPVLADVGEDLNITAATVEAALTDKTKAIIVAHLFGNPADIGAILEIARPKNICVIDDGAQAVGATVNGQPIGSFGNAGVLSFGCEKVCFGIGGGVVADPEGEKLRGISQIDLPPPAHVPLVKSLMSTMIWRRWRRWTKSLRSLLSFNGTEAPDAHATPYRWEAMANLNAAVAMSLLDTLSENIAGRRRRVSVYQELLGAEERLALIAHHSGSACLTQVMRILPTRYGDDLAAQVVDALNDAGFEVQGSYIPIHLLPGYETLAQRRLRHAERVWAELVELPCEPQVSLNQVERIAAIVKRIVKS
jgi:dTDP-4-amino-4,6-dideoxygalactose transaminase